MGNSLKRFLCGSSDTHDVLVLNTFPVDSEAVQDGDGVTVYANVSNSESPKEVVTAVVECNQALAERNYALANALKKQVKDAGYAVINNNNKQYLARKYRIRLRGIDAPENSMPYGKEAKDELVRILSRQCLKILVYDEDQYGRFVGDIYCNGIFVQKLMLKNGFAWHYTAYDNRPKLAKSQETRVVGFIES